MAEHERAEVAAAGPMTARIDAAIDAAAERFEDSSDVTGDDVILELREAAAALRAEVLAPVAALADEADSESESMGMARPPWRSRVWTSDLRVALADPDA